jgi:hypothetical protein
MHHRPFAYYSHYFRCIVYVEPIVKSYELAVVSADVFEVKAESLIVGSSRPISFCVNWVMHFSFYRVKSASGILVEMSVNVY